MRTSASIPIVVAVLTLILGVPAVSHASVVISASATSGQSVDLTQYANFVHVTGTSGAISTAPTLSSGLPSTAVSSGTAIGNFSDTYTNTGFIGGNTNPNAVLADHGSSPNNPNNRYWFDQTWGAENGVSFTVTLPTAGGTVLVYAGGASPSPNLVSSGGSSLSATVGLDSDNESLTGISGSAQSNWGALYEVLWSGRTAGDILSITLSNVRTTDFGDNRGNTGLIAVAVVPVPAPAALPAGLGLIGLLAARRRRR